MSASIRVRAKRDLFLAHHDCGTISIILAGTPGRLVGVWSLKDEFTKTIDSHGHDGYEEIPHARRAEIYPVIEWDAMVVQDDTDGEYECEGLVRTGRDTNHGTPWDAIEFLGVETEAER